MPVVVNLFTVEEIDNLDRIKAIKGETKIRLFGIATDGGAVDIDSLKSLIDTIFAYLRMLMLNAGIDDLYIKKDKELTPEQIALKDDFRAKHDIMSAILIMEADAIVNGDSLEAYKLALDTAGY